MPVKGRRTGKWERDKRLRCPPASALALGEEIFLVRVGVHLPLGSRSGGLDEMPHQTGHHGLASHASVDDELAAGPCGEARGWPTAETSWRSRRWSKPGGAYDQSARAARNCMGKLLCRPLKVALGLPMQARRGHELRLGTPPSRVGSQRPRPCAP